MLKYFISYLLSENALIIDRGAGSEQNGLLHVRKAVLYGCNGIHSLIEKDKGSSRLKVDHSKVDTSSELIEVFTNMVWPEILEAKYYWASDM